LIVVNFFQSLFLSASPLRDRFVAPHHTPRPGVGQNLGTI
jgi:hypothetical protein